jgi:hypothetical protein
LSLCKRNRSPTAKGSPCHSGRCRTSIMMPRFYPRSRGALCPQPSASAVRSARGPAFSRTFRYARSFRCSRDRAIQQSV